MGLMPFDNSTARAEHIRKVDEHEVWTLAYSHAFAHRADAAVASKEADAALAAYRAAFPSGG